MLVRETAMEYNARALGQSIRGLRGHERTTEMKDALRSTCLAVLALIVAGCGRKPQVPENTVAAAYVDLEKTYENGKLLISSIINEFPASSNSVVRNVLRKEYDKVFKAIDEYREVLKPKWAVIAFGGALKALSHSPSENIAIAIRVDADEATVDDMLKQLIVKRTGKDDIKPETRKNGVIFEAYSFHAGRVGDDLLILANSKDAFMGMFNLYTGEGLPSKDFTELPRISGHTLARIQTVPIHSLISRLELTGEIENFGKVSDDEDLADMILHLGAVTLDILADGNDIGLSLRIICGSSDDAKILEHVFQTIAFMSRAGFDLCAYLADNPSRLPENLRHYRGKINQSKDFFIAASRAFDAARDGRIAEITFASSMDEIAQSIAKIIIPRKPVEKGPPETPKH